MQPGGSGADRTGPYDGASFTDPVRAPATPPGPRPFTSTAGAAALCWLGALVTGPVAPVDMLALTWKDRSTPTRGHAIAASLVWGVMLAVYLPVFAVGILWPSFNRDSGGPNPGH